LATGRRCQGSHQTESDQELEERTHRSKGDAGRRRKLTLRHDSCLYDLREGMPMGHVAYCPITSPSPRVHSLLSVVCEPDISVPIKALQLLEECFAYAKDGVRAGAC
jgi:hypothetical protein